MELLVVIAIIALLLAIFMPALQRVNEQAQAIRCTVNLKDWILTCLMYPDYNNLMYAEDDDDETLPTNIDECRAFCREWSWSGVGG
jgi:Tfp pilus assembly protein PilE